MRQATTALQAAAAETAALPTGAARSQQLRALATILVGASEEQWSQALLICPDLQGVEAVPDAESSGTEAEIMALLQPPDLELIDRELLAGATHGWQKGTRVIGAAMVSLGAQLPGLPLCLYARRITALVTDGRLQQRGHAAHMRLCELRLPAR